jgi:hypothetical protein
MMQPVILNCAKCTGKIPRYTGAQSKHFYCEKCGAYYVAEKGDLPAVKTNKVSGVIKGKFSFALGQKFTYEAKEYTLIAAVVKEDAKYPEFTWREYTFFHPEHGYIYLSEAQGHWIVLTELDAPPERDAVTQVTYGEKKFSLFQKSRSNTIAAIGEFPGMPLRHSIRYEEYIAPPQMMSCEYTATSVTWFRGDHMTKAEVAQATGIKAGDLPSSTGVGAIEPFKAKIPPRDAAYISMGAIMILMVLFAITGSGTATRLMTVHSHEKDSLTGKVTSAPFVVDARTALLLTYESDCYNNWSELDVELFNETTEESVGTLIGTEYYAGVTEGESWNEGSNNTNVILSSVAPGTYRIIATPARGTANDTGKTFKLEVENNATITSNFWVCFFLLILFPVIMHFRARAFESSRWSSSDYNPYDSGS